MPGSRQKSSPTTRLASDHGAGSPPTSPVIEEVLIIEEVRGVGGARQSRTAPGPPVTCLPATGRRSASAGTTCTPADGIPPEPVPPAVLLHGNLPR